MARGKRKSISQRNQDNLATLEPSSPITANIGTPNTPEKESSDIKTYLKVMREILKQDQEEKNKELEAFKEEIRKNTQRTQRTRRRQNQRDEGMEEGI